MTLYVIIKVSGGLGNQLFQIANAYYLSKRFNRKLVICDKNSSSRPTYWDSVLHNFKSSLIYMMMCTKISERNLIYIGR